MHVIPELSFQRRPQKPSDPIACSGKHSWRNISFMRLQQSFKKGAQRLHSKADHLNQVLKYTILFALLTSACLVGLGYISEAVFINVNALGRQCLDIEHSHSQDTNYKISANIALVTCTDEGMKIPGRSFEGLINLVAPNKIKYAKRHGYTFIDASDIIDRSRPPSWSKILAVRKHLPKFDWIFWNDVDSLVANAAIPLEDIIESVVRNHPSGVPDLIITNDVTGVNAGMFFLHNTEWSMHFLDQWWNQTAFVRPFGQKKSGDNDALKYLLQSMPKEEFQRHVAVPQMQCAFNSYLWRPTLKSGLRFIKFPQVIWQGAYSKGDFMVHFAGLNNKKLWLQKLLTEFHEGGATTKNIYRRGGLFLQNYL